MSSTYNASNVVDISLLPEHDNIEIFLQDGWRDGLCKCTKVNYTIFISRRKKLNYSKIVCTGL